MSRFWHTCSAHGTRLFIASVLLSGSQVEESEIDEEPLDENIGGEAAVPTTEVPKKFKAGSVRPFRSNDDLLAALKRRREQAATRNNIIKYIIYITHI